MTAAYGFRHARWLPDDSGWPKLVYFVSPVICSGAILHVFTVGNPVFRVFLEPAGSPDKASDTRLGGGVNSIGIAGGMRKTRKKLGRLPRHANHKISRRAGRTPTRRA